MGSVRTLLIETPLECVRRNVARERCKAVTSGHGLGGVGDAISSFFTAPGANQQQAERAQQQPQQREPPVPPLGLGPGPEGKGVNTRITTPATPVATAPASNPGADPTALSTNGTTATANDVNTTREGAPVPAAQFLPSTQAAHNRARAQVMNNDALPSPTPTLPYNRSTV